MLYIVTHEGEMFHATEANKSHLEDAGIEYTTVDTSKFYDIEWEYINGMRKEVVYDYVTELAAKKR